MTSIHSNQSPRILTLNHHESYLCLLAATELPMEVLTKWQECDMSWSASSRAVPSCLTLLTDDKSTRDELRKGTFDVVILHTIRDLIRFFLFFKPRYIFVAHIFLRWNSVSAILKSLAKIAVWHLFRSTHRAQMISISPAKQRSWAVPSELILNFPGDVPVRKQSMDSKPFLIIGNRVKTRGDEAGFHHVQRLLDELPLRLVGNNPDVPGALVPKSTAEFFDMIAHASIYLYVIPPPHDDAYNLGMLEAMKMEMPVICLRRQDCIITDGYDGFVCDSIDDLIHRAKSLANDQELCEKLGRNAQLTVNSKFSQVAFVSAWQSLLNETK